MNNDHGVKWLQLRFLFPAILFILLVNIYPFVTGILYSFKSGTLIKPGTFVGFANYIKVLKMDELWAAFSFSFWFTLFSVIGSFAVGLFLAILLNMNIPGRGLFPRAADCALGAFLCRVDGRLAVDDRQPIRYRQHLFAIFRHGADPVSG